MTATSAASVRERAFARFPQPAEDERNAALTYALTALEERSPGMTAKGKLAPWQRLALIASVAVAAAGVAVSPKGIAAAYLAVLVITYGLTLVLRLVLFAEGTKVVERSRYVTPPPLDDEDLPRYTILMPAYREPEVISALVRATTAINYPLEKLELLLLLEEDDDQTLSVLLDQELPEVVKVLLVPAADPRTKPKACNYGLYFARSEIVTIYDAEDRPEPDQLRDAATMFAHGPEELVCLQARLDYYNESQNLLTKWFAVEYATWFAMVLPGLDALRIPIPLGGTSNHIRTEVLRHLGAWDAYNVTEDADLGMRLARAGLKTGVLQSVTHEEANSEVVNWIRQRSRWYKGYLQTWLVHSRSPRSVLADLGGWRSFAATLLIGGMPVLSALNLFTWTCTAVCVIGAPGWVYTICPLPVIYLGLAITLIGNAATVYVEVLAMVYAKESRFAWASLTYPLYWLLMAVAATKAVYQLIRKPFYWEKTLHGLDAAVDPE